MIGRTVSIFGRAATRGRARNMLIRDENAPGTVSKEVFSCLVYHSSGS